MTSHPALVTYAGIVLLAGGMRAGAADKPKPSNRIMDVTAQPMPPRIIARNGARWSEDYDAAGYPKNCGTPEYKDYCLPGKLVVRNEQAGPMVCHGEIRMPPGNKLSLPDATRDMIVPGSRSVILVKAMTAVNTGALSHASDCKLWQPPSPPASKAGCRFEVSAGPIELDYPPGAKERDEEGPVVLHFTLPASPGRPEKIEVAGSSLFSELDAAAVRTLGATDMTTECPGSRFSIQLEYKLTDWTMVDGVPRIPPPQLSPSGEACETRLLRPANPEDFYPTGSVARKEQGIVIVRVSAATRSGPPLDVTIDTSSGFAELDAAGVLTVNHSIFSTNCTGHSIRLKVKFVLKPAEAAPPPDDPGDAARQPN